MERNNHETMAAGAAPFPWLQMGLLFLAMIAQYVYYHGCNKIDWSGFTRRFFASPIVLLPLVSATQRSMTGIAIHHKINCSGGC